MLMFNSRIFRTAAFSVGFLSCVFCLFCGFSFCQQSPPVPASPAPASQTPASSVQPDPAATSPAKAAQPLPDAPGTTPASTAPPEPAYEKQDKRIMGVLPNFRSVSAGAIVPKETMREKLVTATEDNYDYTSLFFAGVIAADSFATKSTPEFHQGAAGYARYYWHTVADQSIENYFVELIIPTITHEDSRYYALGPAGGGLFRRAGYSLSRALVTRTETDKPTFNYSEIIGSAAAAGISIFYYPPQERTVANGFRNWGLNVTYDSVTFVFHEFWPDIRHTIFKDRGRKASTNP